MTPLRTLALLAVVAGVSSAQTSDCSYVGLLTYLNLTTANDLLAITRPVKNWTTPTLVLLDMVLFGILQVDGKAQTVTTHIWTQMSWKNEFLTWNASDFCGIDEVTVPRSRLWIPDIDIQEDASDTGSVKTSPVVSLVPSGVVMTNARQRLTSTCLLNLSLFPFDKQRCTISFASMNLEADTITMGTSYSDAQLSLVSEWFMVTRGEWDLDHLESTVERPAKSRDSRNKLVYTITISRKPMLYVINLIMPLFYFLILDLGSFFISEARGEKLSFKVTVLLSISVLLLILKDMLPSTEDRLPMIAIYCVVIFVLVGLSILEAMLMSFLFDLDASCCVKAQSPVAPGDVQLGHMEVDGAEATPEKSPPPPRPDGGGDLLRGILEEVKAARQEAEGRHEDERKPGRYRRLAEIIDSVYFAFYFVTVVVFLTYMTVTWVSQIL